MTAKRKKAAAPASQAAGRPNVKHAIDEILDDYFTNLNGQKPRNIHKVILGHVEHRLLENTMRRVESNQSKAAEMLGLSRSTLRTKLEQYKIPRRAGRPASRK